MTRAIAAAWLVVAACGRTPFQTIYLKGPPQRVEVTKQAEPAAIEVRAVRAGELVRLTVRERAPVRLERSVTKSTYVVEGRGDWKWEWVETLLGLALSPVLPFVTGLPRRHVEGPDTRMVLSGNPVVLFPDPRTTLLGASYTGRFSLDDAFPAKPEHRRYRIALPLPGESVRYRVITAERAIAREGEATTSRFGELAISDVPSDAVGVEVTHRGRTRLIVIE